MKTNIIFAIILIVIGIASFGYQGFNYTTREKIIDIGSLTVEADKTNTVKLPPIIGATALAGGIVLLILGSRKD